MKINEMMNEKFDPNKIYPDTAEGAVECFTDISNYNISDITKVYPDPYVNKVWAIHTDTKHAGSEKHIVWLDDHDFATDDRSGDDNFKISESASCGASSAGGIASVATSLGSGEIIRRSVYGSQKKKRKKSED